MKRGPIPGLARANRMPRSRSSACGAIYRYSSIQPIHGQERKPMPDRMPVLRPRRCSSRGLRATQLKESLNRRLGLGIGRVATVANAPREVHWEGSI